MLVLVLGDSLPVMFVGWEGVGLCSYLLIGFWYNENANADAGKKAFIINRIGDFGFLLGMFLLFQYTGTLNFTEITAAAHAGLGADCSRSGWARRSPSGSALFLFIGATGKSAQIPLYVWLPDAMAGPTPVSALIHAATMVTAGVYMVARLHARLSCCRRPRWPIVAIVGALTALFAAIIGFAQNDFKKVLAYSTVSQLGFMFVGVGTGNFDGGIFHLFTHAFFKAGLFLCAGSVMHAMSGSGDITQDGRPAQEDPLDARRVRRLLARDLRHPVFSGFFSKDAIIAGAFATEVYGAASWPGSGTFVGVRPAASPRSAPRSTCRGSTSWSSPGESRADARDPAPHPRVARHAWSGRWWCWPSAPALGGLIGIPGGAVRPPRPGTCSASGSTPVLGPALEVPHTTELGVHGRLDGAGAARHRPRLRCSTAAATASRRSKFARRVPAASCELVRDKFRIDELYDCAHHPPAPQARRVACSRSSTASSSTRSWSSGVGVRRRRVRPRRALPAERRRRSATWRRSPSASAALVFFAHADPPSPDALKVTVSGLAVDVDARRARHGRAARALEYSFDFDDDGKPEAHRHRARRRTTPTRRPGDYTIRVDGHGPALGHQHVASSRRSTVQLMGVLGWITLLPLFGAVLVMLVPREEEAIHRGLGLATALVTFWCRCSILGRTSTPARPASSWRSTRSWIAPLGIHFHLGVDGISLWLVLLTTFLMPLTLLSPQAIGIRNIRVREFIVAHAGPRDRHDRRVPRARPVRLLRVLGADADPDVLHHRDLGRRAAALRRRSSSSSTRWSARC